VALAVAATRPGVVATTSRVRCRAHRVRTLVVMAVLMVARIDRPVMGVRVRPVDVRTEARCPMSVPAVVCGVSLLCVGRRSARPAS